MEPVSLKRSYSTDEISSSKEKNQKKQRPSSEKDQITSEVIIPLLLLSSESNLPARVLDQASPISVTAFSLGESLPAKPALESKKNSLLYEKHMKDFGASIKWFQERFSTP